MKSVSVSKYSVDELIGFGVDESDFENGSGVYKIVFGSRGYVEEVEFVGSNDVVEVYENRDELLKEWCGDLNTEYCDVFDYMFDDDRKVYGVVLGEEYSFEYYFVVV